MTTELKQAMTYLCHTRNMLDRKAEHTVEEAHLFDALTIFINHTIENDRGFDTYLREKHMEDYNGLDDDAPDDFEDWLVDKEPEEIHEYFDCYLCILK